MLLTVSYFLLVMQCTGESGRGSGKDAQAADQFFNSPSLFLLQVTEKLLEVENETMMKLADLEKVLLQKDKELHTIRVSWKTPGRSFC